MYSDSFEQVSLTCTVTAMRRSAYRDSFEQVSLTCTVTAINRSVSFTRTIKAMCRSTTMSRSVSPLQWQLLADQYHLYSDSFEQVITCTVTAMSRLFSSVQWQIWVLEQVSIISTVTDMSTRAGQYHQYSDSSEQVSFTLQLKLWAGQYHLYSDSYEQVSLTCTVATMNRSVSTVQWQLLALCTLTAFIRSSPPVHLQLWADHSHLCSDSHDHARAPSPLHTFSQLIN